jgi:hypothetical protein
MLSLKRVHFELHSLAAMKNKSLLTLFLSHFLIALAMPLQAQAAKTSLEKDIQQLQLTHYEKAGESVAAHLRRTFISLDETADEGNFAEKMDQLYLDKIRPGALEKVSTTNRYGQVDQFISDVHSMLSLKQKYALPFRQSPKIRKKIQNIFIGALHVIDIQIRNELDSSLDELLRIRRFLLTQGTFITRGSGRLITDDLWWDWMWLRGNSYATDLTEWHLQKVKSISNQSGPIWKEQLKKYSVSVIALALKKNTQPLLGREKNSAITLRLTENAIDLLSSSPMAPVALQKELKLYHYRGLQANGQTYEASLIKKEIAMDLFIAKGWQIVKSPTEPWQRDDLNLASKAFASLSKLINSIFTFITYGAGFIFVATPIEFLLIVTALVILSKQGETHFNQPVPRFRDLINIHRIKHLDGWQRWPAFIRDILSIVVRELHLACKMFVASYTSTVPFYSKVASSLLLFGFGLYMNSARTLVEAVLQQMTTM